MTRPTISDLVTATGELATLPSTVIALLDVLKDTTTSADRVRAVLERDPAMTANTLKLANSAYYGVRRTISSVRDALVMLGNRAVATLAFATGMAPVLRRDLEGYGEERDAFWRHSLVAGAAASRAADLAGHGWWRTQAFTGGLIHDVGMLVIDRWLVAEGRHLPRTQDESAQRQAERELLGFDHAETGAALAEAWGFPDLLVAALRHHHTPLDATSDRALVAAVAAGDLVSAALAGWPERPWPAATVAELAGLGFRAEDFDQLRLDLAGDLDETLAAATRPGGVLV
ncbi:MAG: HDOD domain-containing protein [Candidatus Krumholzibacteriia bacterium]